jgi:hypothetical protein
MRKEFDCTARQIRNKNIANIYMKDWSTLLVRAIQIETTVR